MKPPPVPLSPAQVELALLEGAEKARAANLATRPRPSRVAFDRAIANAGGHLGEAAKNILDDARAAAKADRGELRAGGVMPMFCETTAERDEREERQREADRQRLIKMSGVPDEYVEARLNEASRLPPDCRDQWLTMAESLRQAVIPKKAIVGLCGSRGPGKTHAACAIVLDQCRQRVPARWIKARDYFKAVTEEWRPRGSVARVERAMREPRLLVLDELQDRSRGETLFQYLTALVDDRYNDGKVTVLVANLTTVELQASVGESIEDRMHEAGGILVCDWPSVRGRLLNSAGSGGSGD